MKIFLSYRYTGEVIEDLMQFLESAKKTLEENGHEVFCYSLEKVKYGWVHSNKEILDICFKNLENSDWIVPIVKSDQKSEGMLLEIGYAQALKKKMCLVIREGIGNVFLEQIATKIHKFKDNKEILGILKRVEF